MKRANPSLPLPPKMGSCLMNGLDLLGTPLGQQTFLDGIRGNIKAALGMSAADLIDWSTTKYEVGPTITGYLVSTRVFSSVDYAIFNRLWQWARRRDPKKSSRWLKQKYFERHGGNNWSFFGASCDNEGTPHKVRLLLASSTPTQRHVKIKSAANPYDPAHETYFEKREGDHMAETSGYADPSLSLDVPTRGLPRVQHQDHLDHGLAPSLLRSPCERWFHECRKPRPAPSRVPRQGSPPTSFRLEAASP
jgi:hypothetical protein